MKIKSIIITLTDIIMSVFDEITSKKKRKKKQVLATVNGYTDNHLHK